MKKPTLEDLKQAFDDIVWMAIRYANNRHTYAPGMVRDAVAVRAAFGDFAFRHYDETLDGPDKDGGMVCEGDNLKDLYEKYGKKEE